MGSGETIFISCTWLLLATVGQTKAIVNEACCADICQSYRLNGIQHLDCSNLGLTELPDGLDASAQVVDLSNNNFAAIPPQLETFTQLEDLILSGNHISNPLPRFVQSWENLKTLNLSSNNLDKWTNFRLGTNIRKLDLSRNKINKIEPSSFTDMPLLTYVDLSENRLYDLPNNVFFDAKNLDTVLLSQNYFASVPEFESTSLRILDLSNCQITTLRSDSFAGKTTLLEIDLSINEIDFIPDNIASNTLQVLNLAYNGISTLTDRTFSSLPHMAVLDLRGNNFRDVWETSYFSSNLFLKEVYVKGNRWSCEGFSINLLLTYEFLTREPPKVTDRASLICYSPSNVTQMSWQEAYIKTWHPASNAATITLTAVFVGVIIGIVVTGCVCRGVMAMSSRSEPRPQNSSAAQNLNGAAPVETRPRVETTEMRIPLTEDLPPTYDEALLMPRFNASFHSLPDFVDEEEVSDNRQFRRSRSINDMLEARPRASDRRSVRTTVRTVVIDIE